MSRSLLIVVLGGTLLAGCGSCSKQDEPAKKTEAAAAAPARDVPSANRRNLPPERVAPGEMKRQPPSAVGTLSNRGPSQLTEEERASLIEERKAMREARRQETMDEFDVDKDGKLSEDEREKMRTARAEQRFTEVDTDGDGTISQEELAAAQTGRRMPIDFASADTDHDGRLTSQELSAGMQLGRQQMRERIQTMQQEGKLRPPPAPEGEPPAAPTR